MSRPLVLPDHNLTAEVYSVLPVTEAIEVDLVAFRVYDRYRYAADERDVLPPDLEGPVRDRLRRLVAKGKAARIGGGWKRATGSRSAP